MSFFDRRALLTGSALSSRVSQWRARGLIKSIQRGTITLNGAASGTATITAVDVNNAIVLWQGGNQAGADGNLARFVSRVVLTNATTVTATAGAAPVANLVIGYEVIEFVPGVIKSMQRGTISMGGTASATATITAVDTTKTMLIQGGMTNSLTTPQANTATFRVELTNATTVTAKNDGASGTVVLPYQAVEWF